MRKRTLRAMVIVAISETLVARETVMTPTMSANRPLSVADHLNATHLVRRGGRMEEAPDEIMVGARIGAEDASAARSYRPEK